MSPFEREVIDRLGRIETKLDADFRTLHGNGQPGLVQKHDTLGARVDRLETTWKTWGVVGGLLLGAVSVIHALISIFAKLFQPN